jgi:hypothetical protein
MLPWDAHAIERPRAGFDLGTNALQERLIEWTLALNDDSGLPFPLGKGPGVRSEKDRSNADSIFG